MPNKLERYTASLRNTVESLVIKNGITAKNRYMLMKIHRAEALYCDEVRPIDIYKFSNEILNWVFIKKTELAEKFIFSVEPFGNYIINIKAYLALLLSLSKKSSQINIKKYNNKILIKAYNADLIQNIFLIKKLGGIYFNETVNGVLYILIPATKTDKKSAKYKKDWTDLSNPLSVINCYL
ncbi:MAG: hypothetical protein IKY45_01375 [Clostridia bacterium]|nr:hypothetical protein [Clostridia bacterium]